MEIRSLSKRFLLGLIIALVVVVVMVVLALVLKERNSERNAPVTFYIDDRNGNDSNDGRSESTAWQSLDQVNRVNFIPGDKILFRSGGKWRGQLYPKGSGVEGSPIVIDRYGSGPLPAIDGNGQESAVYLYNQQHYEINNLEVTNKGERPGNRKGIHIVGKNVGILRHFRLNGLVVHDVNGNNDFSAEGKATGGIMFDIPEYDTVKTKFSDVVVENCTIYAVDRTGIYAFSGWWREADQYRSEGLIIRNNEVHDIGGDGIIVIGFDKSIVERNVVHDCNSRSESYAVGMFAFGSDDTIFQYNEVYKTRTTEDGQGIDIDYYTRRTIVQYNYSHDNEGGFLLVCRPGSEKEAYNSDSVIRYNISVNDGKAAFNLGGPVNNVNIYNNTIYADADMLTNVFAITDWDGGYASNVFITNNLFYNMADGQYLLGEGTNINFNNNFYYESPFVELPSDSRAMTENPRFVQPGSSLIGRQHLEGYRLSPNSPYWNRGQSIPDDGDIDFVGHRISDPPSIGAFDKQE